MTLALESSRQQTARVRLKMALDQAIWGGQFYRQPPFRAATPAGSRVRGLKTRPPVQFVSAEVGVTFG
jgi:hypothetical protein